MSSYLFPLLSLLCLAPACAPEKADVQAATPTQNLVLLTDTTLWSPPALQTYRDSLTSQNYRVLISGSPGETTEALMARLPWLLQPGVDLFIYDEGLAGTAATDSIRAYLRRKGHPAEVVNR